MYKESLNTKVLIIMMKGILARHISGNIIHEHFLKTLQVFSSSLFPYLVLLFIKSI